ncbi:MAG: 2-oxoacid:acceptor oxidoreductase family protein [Bryobacteraceae bacterium]|jgi:2-oxoisovalerate ferredoxin oxidoreductase beta subunit
MQASYTVTHQKAKSFYEVYERKDDFQHQTHYCPGCGHGIASKLLARAIDELGIQDRTVLISPVGCSVFLYYYFDVGNVQVSHGRAPAVATGVKRSLPESIVIAYQGDGDLAAIGTAEILHAANRGEPITVIFVNNGIYGMTGGQMAPTTPLGKKSTTSPFGRNVWVEGPPVRMSEILNSLDAPVFIERVGLGDNKQIMQAARVIKRAVEYQVKRLGFSFVEVLSPCPTIWKLDPVEAQRFVREQMAPTFPLGNLRDRAKDAPLRPAPAPAPPVEDLPRILGLGNGNTEAAAPAARPKPMDLRIRIAGFGGQGVLMLGEVLAEAGLGAGYNVSWLPSYGPEMRSGTSNCHVRIGSAPVDSPLVSRPNMLLAMNEPSLRKFLPTVEPGGLVLYNGESLPEGCARPDVRMIAAHFTRVADEIGSSKAANMVMLGALLEASAPLDEEFILSALRKKVKSQRWFDLDVAALSRGRQQVQ